MRLKSLNISRGYSGDRPLCGSVEFSGKGGEIKINVDEAASQKIVELCADGIIEASRQVAENMTAEILTGATTAKRIE